MDAKNPVAPFFDIQFSKNPGRRTPTRAADGHADSHDEYCMGRCRCLCKLLKRYGEIVVTRFYGVFGGPASQKLVERRERRDTRVDRLLALQLEKTARGHPYGYPNKVELKCCRRGFYSEHNLIRLRGLAGRRGLLPVRSADGFAQEVPFTFVAVALPHTISANTDFDTLNRLISLSNFEIRFDEGILLDDRNTRNVSGVYVLPDPKALVQLLG